MQPFIYLSSHSCATHVGPGNKIPFIQSGTKGTLRGTTLLCDRGACWPAAHFPRCSGRTRRKLGPAWPSITCALPGEFDLWGAWRPRRAFTMIPARWRLAYYSGSTCVVLQLSNSGPRGIRTLDLLNAIETRSQLRYRPASARDCT